MTTNDWQARDDWSPSDHRSAEQGIVLSPFVAQGVRNALRNAYADIGEGVPPELSALLERLQ